MENGMYAGAYYLAGYAVECALKAAVAKQVNQHDFPDIQLARDSHTHDVEALLRLSGIKHQFQIDSAADPKLEINWSVAREWRETFRYLTSVNAEQAQELFGAITDPTSGVLTCIRKWW